MDSVFLITISAFILAVILIIITIVIIKSNQNKKYKKEIEELKNEMYKCKYRHYEQMKEGR